MLKMRNGQDRPEALPSIVHSYGCRVTPESQAIVDQQLRLAERHYGNIVEIKRHYFSLYESLIAQDITGETAEYARLAGLLQTEKEKQPYDKDAVATAEQVLKVAGKALGAARKVAKDKHKDETKAIFDSCKAEIKDANAVAQKSGLHHGTKGDICQSLAKSLNPDYKPFGHWKKLTLQVKLSSNKTPWTINQQRSELTVGETVGKFTPVTITFNNKMKINLSVIIHRSIPVDCHVTFIGLQLVQNKWQLQLTLARLTGWEKPYTGSGSIGFDLGWANVEEGVRYAYWADDSGRHGQLVVKNSYLTHYKELQTVIDKNFDIAKKTLLESDYPHKPQYLAQWKSNDKLAAFVLTMPYGSDLAATMNEWRTQYLHLKNWRNNERQQACKERKHTRDTIATALRREYARVFIEGDFTPQDTIKKKYGGRQGNQQYGFAAPSEFIKCLGNVIGVPKNNTTKLCHICGSKLKIDGRVATCQNCGAMDRDYNAAKNILQRGLEMLKLSNFSTKIKLNSLQGKELVSSVV